MTAQVTLTATRHSLTTYTRHAEDGTVATAEVTETAAFTAAVTGAEPIRKRRNDRPWQPDWITVQWRRANQGTWSSYGLKVGGAFLKRDGTPGVQRTEDYIWTACTPGWVQLFLDGTRPQDAEQLPQES